MDSYSEEIWKDRIRDKVNVDKVKDLKSFIKELETLTDSSTITRTRKDGKKTTFTKDMSRQKQALIDNAELFIKGSKSVQDVISENVSEDIEEADTLDKVGRIHIMDIMPTLEEKRVGKERELLERMIKRTIESERSTYGDDWNKVRRFGMFKSLVGKSRQLTEAGIDLREIFERGTL